MVKKIFTVLGTVVGCVAVVAFALNILLPNVVTGTVNAVEGMIYNATKIDMDFNGDGVGGKANASGSYDAQQSGSGDATLDGIGVDGFQ